MKYKPGDKVVVRDDLRLGVRYYSKDGGAYSVATPTMIRMRGKVATIKEITYHRYFIYESGFYWTDDMFDGIAMEEEQVKISESEKKAICSFLEV